MTDQTDKPWLWPEDVWRRKVAHVRGGRSLKPKAWKDGACCAVAISFDSDHETVELRFGGKSYGKMSQGERLDALMEPGGIAACGNAQNCVEVCPKQIPLTEAFGELGRQTTFFWLQQLFQK